MTRRSWGGRGKIGALALAVLGLPGCEEDPPVEEGPTFSLMADRISGGALMSAWSDGDTLLMVGGEIGSGGGIAATWDGDRLCVERDVADKTLWWVHGPRAGEWYAVGEGGRIVHSVDGVRTREDVPTEATLYGVYASGDEAVAVGGAFDAEGGHGEIWRRREEEWSAVVLDLPRMAFKTWEGFVVGDQHVWRIDGDAVVDSWQGDDRLLTVRGRGADDAYAVGGASSPVLLHWDGASWTPSDAGPLTQALAGVWTAPGEAVWVAGLNGATAFLDDEGWHAPEWPVSGEHFHAVWKHGDEVFFVGGNWMATSGERYGTIARYGEEAAEVQAEDCG